MNYTNRQVAESFANMVNGTQTGSAKSGNGNFRAETDSFGNVSLYSYSTKIAYYEKATQTLIFNRTRYSTTTSTKHQTHFYLIARNAYRVSQTATIDYIVQDNDLTRYIATNRYTVEDGESWNGEKLYKVFDQIGNNTICTYKKRHFAARKVAELNEAQALKG